jgi:hypothetical protein
MLVNPSKHIPVLLKLDVEIMHRYIDEGNTEVKGKPIAWNRVNDNDTERYQRAQDRILQGLEINNATQCHNVQCKSLEHRR